MIKVVYGAPASGKSTYVKKHIKDNDIVYDYDALMQCLTLRDKYDRNNNASYLITFLRGSIIKQHTMNNNKIDDIWIITTNISDRLKKDLSVIPDEDIEYIKMKTSLKTCLKRIDEDEARKPLAEDMKKTAIKWFEEYKDVDLNEKQKSTYELIVESLKEQNDLLNKLV